MAFWVSLYEPLILLVGSFCCSRSGALSLTAPPRRLGWWIFLGILALAAVVERRGAGVARLRAVFCQLVRHDRGIAFRWPNES